jgi:hypothetical protein
MAGLLGKSSRGLLRRLVVASSRPLVVMLRVSIRSGIVMIVGWKWMKALVILAREGRGM